MTILGTFGIVGNFGNFGRGGKFGILISLDRFVGSFGNESKFGKAGNPGNLNAPGRVGKDDNVFNEDVNELMLGKLGSGGAPLDAPNPAGKLAEPGNVGKLGRLGRPGIPDKELTCGNVGRPAGRADFNILDDIVPSRDIIISFREEGAKYEGLEPEAVV